MIIFALIFLLWAFSAEAATWYVKTPANGGNNANDCLASQNPNFPKETVNAALRCVGSSTGSPISSSSAGGQGAGHTVEVWAGTYTENLDEFTGNPFPGGTVGNYFTLKARNSTGGALTNSFRGPDPGADNVIIQGLGSGNVIGIAGASPGPTYIRIQGIHFRASNTNLEPSISGLGGNIQFYGNKFSNSRFNMFNAGASFIDFRYNIVSDMQNTTVGGVPKAGYAIYLSGDDGIYEGNVFTNIPLYAIHMYSCCTVALRNHIRYNDISNFGWGVSEEGGVNNVGGVAVGIHIGNNNQVYGNLIHDANNPSGNAVAFVNAGSGNVFYNNTVTNLFATQSLIQAQVAGGTWRNNIFTNLTSTSTEATIIGTQTFSRNLCDSSMAATSGGTCDAVLTQTATDTFITASASGNYRLKAPPPTNRAIGAGTVICPARDLTGATLSGSPPCDVGAYSLAGVTPPGTIAITQVGAPAVFLTGISTAAATVNTSANTIDIQGTATCPTTANITWVNSRTGVTGTATGTSATPTWVASGINLATHPNLVHTITFTVNCASGPATATVKVRANGPDAIVLMLAFNENTGTTAVDISGVSPANTATFTGAGNLWVPGKFGSAVQIGATGGLIINNATTLNPSLFTLSAYVYPLATATDYRAILRKHPTGGDGGYMLYASEAGFTGCGAAGLAMGGYQASGLYTTACSTGALPLKVWTHIVITADGQNVRFYLDGTLIDTKPATELLLENTGALNLGFAGTFGEQLSGAIDELVILNKAVPATGASDVCSITLTAANASVAKLKNCALGAPPPGTPTSITIGVNSTVTFGPGATATIGVQQ